MNFFRLSSIECVSKSCWSAYQLRKSIDVTQSSIGSPWTKLVMASTSSTSRLFAITASFFLTRSCNRPTCSETKSPTALLSIVPNSPDVSALKAIRHLLMVCAEASSAARPVSSTLKMQRSAYSSRSAFNSSSLMRSLVKRLAIITIALNALGLWELTAY